MMEKLEEAIKKKGRSRSVNQQMNDGKMLLTNEKYIRVSDVLELIVAFKKDHVIVPRKKLEEMNVFEWLRENHRDKERFAVLGANLIETLQLFIKKELLEEKTK